VRGIIVATLTVTMTSPMNLGPTLSMNTPEMYLHHRRGSVSLPGCYLYWDVTGVELPGLLSPLILPSPSA